MFDVSTKLKQAMDRRIFIRIHEIADAMNQKHYDLNEHKWVFTRTEMLVVIDLMYDNSTGYKWAEVVSPTDQKFSIHNLPLWREIVEPWQNDVLSHECLRAWLKANQDKFECI
jgi:hypothetical protein